MTGGIGPSANEPSARASSLTGSSPPARAPASASHASAAVARARSTCSGEAVAGGLDRVSAHRGHRVRDELARLDVARLERQAAVLGARHEREAVDEAAELGGRLDDQAQVARVLALDRAESLERAREPERRRERRPQVVACGGDTLGKGCGGVGHSLSVPVGRPMCRYRDRTRPLRRRSRPP